MCTLTGKIVLFAADVAFLACTAVQVFALRGMLAVSYFEKELVSTWRGHYTRQQI